MDNINDVSVNDTFTGTVVKITYQNALNGYTVATFSDGGNEITAVGSMPFISKGDDVTLTGNYIIHPTYGKQLKVSSYQKNIPSTLSGILRYLSSGAIRGVGPSTARKIVSRFGENTINILKDEPERLSEIKGISAEKALSIANEFAKQYGIRDVMLLLGAFKITPEESFLVYKQFGSESVSMVRENPFVLCSDKIGFSFERAEEIALSFNMPKDDLRRVSAGILFILQKNLFNGHTCLPFSKVKSVAADLLDCNGDVVESAIEQLISSMEIYSDDIYGELFLSLPELREAENFIAAKLSALDSFSSIKMSLDDKEINMVESIIGIELDSLQKKAVKMSFENGVLVLTGGPGTGKTTTLKAIIELLEQKKLVYKLTAPTGRAAKRISELTSRPAQTIHRLLEVEFSENEKPVFSRNEKNPLDCDVLIVDEVSMVDSLVFESLLKAVRLGTRIILVGDTDQLPSVSAGNVLNDIISSERFSCITLNKVFRQAEESAIIRAAHAIINNGDVQFTNKDTDLFFIHKSDINDIESTVCELCSSRLKNAYGFDSVKDIQVLCPSRKMQLGAVNINTLLQKALNPVPKGSPEIFYKGFYLHEMDKVMQIKNNYDIVWKKDNGETGAGIFNGDVGFIEKINLSTGLVLIRFDDRIAEYNSENLSEIELAYAVTVHKSQGSEFDCVILPLFDVPTKLRYKNLLYTAVTRAKKMLVLIGDENVFRNMAANEKKTLRYTLLKHFIELKS